MNTFFERTINFLSQPGQSPEIWASQLFAIVFLTLVINFYIRTTVFKKLTLKAAQTQNPWDDALLHAINKPLTWFVWIYGLCFAADLAYAVSHAALFEVIPTVRSVAFIALSAWLLNRFIHAAELNLADKKFAIEPMDPTTLTSISKLLRISVFITAALIVMQSLGYSISGLLAFGGVGGLAVGFAAKDLLANFFGGIMIYLDRPFAPGDWIRSSDKEIEGTVEHIGWRLTRIRTFDQRPLYVPNSIFTHIAVENPSRMNNRRIYETIGLRYNDIKQVDNIVIAIKKYLSEHAEIDTNKTLIVNFVEFSASSLDVMVYTFTKTTDWVKFHEIKHAILLDLANIIEKHGAEMAFPTSTLHLETTGLEKYNLETADSKKA